MCVCVLARVCECTCFSLCVRVCMMLAFVNNPYPLHLAHLFQVLQLYFRGTTIEEFLHKRDVNRFVRHRVNRNLPLPVHNNKQVQIQLRGTRVDKNVCALQRSTEAKNTRKFSSKNFGHPFLFCSTPNTKCKKTRKKHSPLLCTVSTLRIHFPTLLPLPHHHLLFKIRN